MTEASVIIRNAATEPCRPWPRYVLPPAEWARVAAASVDEPTLALLALWADTGNAYALWFDETTSAPLLVSTTIEACGYPALSPVRPVAAWFERMVRDLWGHAATDGTDQRPWLDHGRWPHTTPMALRVGHPGGQSEPPEFLSAAGDDLDQIPLGPVHGGIAAASHLRLTGRGEHIVRLEARLGYTHKGTLTLMRGKSPRAAARFAARLSVEATVAHSVAFARATEAAVQCEVPPRAVALRAVMAELERIAVHLGDLGATADAGGCAIVSARCAFHAEAIHRTANVAFGHRLMMDCVIPGGVAADVAPGGREAIVRALTSVAAGLPELEGLHQAAPLVGMLSGAGVTAAADVARFAVDGVIGQAAGRSAGRFTVFPLPLWAWDAKQTKAGGGVVTVPNPSDTLAPSPNPLPPGEGENVASTTSPKHPTGDAAGRAGIRLAEIAESIRQLHGLVDALPDGAVSIPLPPDSGEGIGIAHGARGDAWHWLRLDHGQIASVFMRDPAWAQWPLLELALVGNQAEDLPLVLASFGLTSSGVDL